MSLAEHPAVRDLGSGVSSVDLADLIGQIAQRTQSRVIGVGHEQYGKGRLQKFETLTPDEIYEELIDEIADIYAYGAFLAIHAMAARNRAGRR